MPSRAQAMQKDGQIRGADCSGDQQGCAADEGQDEAAEPYVLQRGGPRTLDTQAQEQLMQALPCSR